MEVTMDESEIIAALGKLEEAEKWRAKHFGYEGYVPNPMQLRAHKSRARTILYCGGNRAGKSTFGAMELAWHLTKDYPGWYPAERRYDRPVKCAVSATEFAIVGRVIEPKILSFLPQGSYTLRRSPHGYLLKIEFRDGSTVDILTLEMKDEAYESADWDFVWCDEPQSQGKYFAMRRGLIDRSGQMVITFTPLTEPWMKEDLIDRADGKRIEVFEVDIKDNLFDMNGTPILSLEAVQEFEDTLPEDVRETRARGHFFHLRGVVYKEFGEPHCLADMKYLYPDPVIAILDPHDRNPHHVIWAFVDRGDDINVDYEMTVRCDIPTLAQKIRSVEKTFNYNMKKRLIDPNFGLKPSAPGVKTTVMQELGVHGAYFYPANDDIELGHMLTAELLHYNRAKPITATNKPKLFFSKERCPITIRSMKNYQYEDWKGKTKDDREPKETPKQKDDHGAACVRYLTTSKPTYRHLKPSRDDGGGTDGPAY